MEKYTDISHEQYVPGTFSIYSSAIIQQRRRQSVSSKKDTFFDQHNYRFTSNKPLDSIPELKTRFGVILLPQPTNSVNDPLNWSRKRKFSHFFLLILITAFSAAIANDASAPQDSINELTHVSYDALNNSAGLLFVSIAVSSWLYAPLSSLCGRKITYVLGLLFALLGSVWYARIKNTGDAFGSQIFTGFAEGSTEAQVQLSLSSVFFKHQLGSVITIYILATALGTYLGPLCANFISDKHTFRWVGWSGAIAAGALLVIVLLFLEEDSFDYSRFNYDKANILLNKSLMQHGVSSNDDDDNLGYSDVPLPRSRRLAIVTPSKECKSWLPFFKQYFRLLVFNFRCLWFPAVIYSGLIWGFQDAILTFYLTTQDTELYLPPFNYSGARVALMNVPCIIGSVIGCIYAGSLTDYFILWMARKNNGIVESEFRLYFAFLSGIVGSVGLLMFGIGIERNLDWRVIYVGLGMIAYLYSSAGNIAMLYIISTYDQLILETLVGVSVMNNLIGCIFTFACSPWLNRSGTENTYIALAVLNLFIMFLALPLIIWGKSWRKSTKMSYVKMISARK